MSFPDGSDGKGSTCNSEDLDSISGLGRSPGGRHENPLQYFCLENSPVTNEPGRLQSVGLQRVRHDLVGHSQTRLNTNHHKLKCSLKMKVKVTQSCPTLCDPMDYTVHEILQARMLEWVAIPFSGGSSQSRDQTQVSHIAGRFFTS